MTPKQLLSAAADHIEKYGKTERRWLRKIRWLPDFECPSCAMGAMVQVLDPNGVGSPNFLMDEKYDLVREAERVLARHLGLSYEPSGFTDIVLWSDSHTQDEVVAGLRAAAAS